jgi:hypothetical protein
MLRMNTWREVVLLVLAVVCLWIGGDDLRLFLFFAFAVALSEFGRLVAFMRQATLDHEAKLTALCYNAQVPADDVNAAAIGISQRRELPPYRL